ncbi:MAG: hypothetical protein HPY89_04420 [Pelotomaculum sp.]|nr:hypothetical protein [Pelotomaculum sp.]
MKANSLKNSTKDFIVEENGNLFYVVKSDKKKHKSSLTPHFSSFVQRNLKTSDEVRHSKSREVSRLRVFTFLVINEGLNPVICQAEMSTDGITWGSFGESESTVFPGNMQVIVPQYFLRFARLKFKNKKQGFNSAVTIWFQGQS